MVKKILGAIFALIVLLIAVVFLLGNVWQRTEHGTLDFKAALILKARNAFLKEEPLVAEKLRADGNARAKTLQGSPEEVGKVEDMKIPGPAGEILVRVYSPSGNGPFPVLLFYHGVGWVIGNLDTADTACRFLANRVPCLVVSVDYRLAPEHPFPAAVEDCYAALQWVANNGKKLNGDPSRIAVSGSSAGGNLAAAIPLVARDRGGPNVSYQVLIYPATNLSDLSTDSYRFFGKGYGLLKEHVDFFIRCYLPDEKDRINPYASPLLAKDLSGLPPAIVITAGFDVLRDEGKAYVDRLREAGVETVHSHYPTMIHGFLTMDRLFGEAEDALVEISNELKKAFY